MLVYFIIMQCPNTQDKIREAKYFLDMLNSDEVYKNDELYSHNLNAYLTSARSIIDYILRDFLNSIIPIITVNELKKTKGSKKRLKAIMKNHPQKEKIEEFLEFYWNVEKVLHSDPLVNYFLEIRNEMIHHRKISEKGMTVTSTNPQTKEFSKMRTLELPFNDELLEMYPSAKIDYPNKFSKEQILKLEQDIRHTDAKIHLNRFFKKITEFVSKFEALNI